MLKNIQKVIFQIVGATLTLMTIYYVIQLIETFSHHYDSNSKKFDQAKVFVDDICKNAELLRWESIYEQCRIQRDILKRNPLWETIVETSKLFHICYKKKHLHDENKQFGHDHDKKENDDEMDCSFVAVFLAGILTTFVVFIWFFRYCGKNTEKMKSKVD